MQNSFLQTQPKEAKNSRPQQIGGSIEEDEAIDNEVRVPDTFYNAFLNSTPIILDPETPQQAVSQPSQVSEVSYNEQGIIDPSYGDPVGSISFNNTYKEIIIPVDAQNAIFKGFGGAGEAATKVAETTGKILEVGLSTGIGAGVDILKQMSGVGLPKETSEKENSSPDSKISENKQKGAQGQARVESIARQLNLASQEYTARPIVEEKRLKINSLNNLQALFQGSVDAQGNATAYYESGAEAKQREITDEEEKKAQRQQILALATKSKAGGTSQRLDAQEGNSLVANAISSAG